jgi:hypothetical protein
VYLSVQERHGAVRARQVVPKTAQDYVTVLQFQTIVTRNHMRFTGAPNLTESNRIPFEVSMSSGRIVATRALRPDVPSQDIGCSRLMGAVHRVRCDAVEVVVLEPRCKGRGALGVGGEDTLIGPLGLQGVVEALYLAVLPGQCGVMNTWRAPSSVQAWRNEYR